MTSGTHRNIALVVDDDPIVCSMAEDQFYQNGFEKVMCASDGVEALMVLDNSDSDPNFILCDLNMPNMDGVEFLRHLDKRCFTGAVAVLSGEDESVISLVKSLIQSHKLNFAGTMSKPFKAQALKDILTNVKEHLHADEGNPFFKVDVANLRHAINSGEIVAYHQPKVDAASATMVGTEVLARWKHPEWGLLAPVHFISLAEQTGLISTLTQSLFRQAVLDVQRWKTRGFNAKCSINLSPVMLSDLDLPDYLSSIVLGAGLNPCQFVLEITESSVVEKAAEPMEILARLRLKQFDLSIDDFGTGHSNIETLRQFPFNELKIDRSFISGMVNDNFCMETVRSSVQFARKLGMRTVAEGVEDQKQIKIAQEFGIDVLQGFFFGKPMPVSDIRVESQLQTAI